MLREEMPEVLDEVEQLIDQNFRSSLFASPKEIEYEMQERLHRLLHKTIVIPTKTIGEQHSPLSLGTPFIGG